jgi:4'-phosphopantetheinyl transferase
MTSSFHVSFTSLQETTPPANTQVWLLDLNQLNTEAIMECQQLLSADEQIRALNFKRPQTRVGFIATRVLVRRCLARHLAIPAELIKFATEEKGKPYVINAPSNFYFNLSHSDHLVAVAISINGAIGVDIEIDRSRSFMSIAERYFHPNEVVQLQACEAATQRELFFRFWTLKEAFFKALGGGIATGLNKIQFDLHLTGKIDSITQLNSGAAINFSFAEELGLQKNEWQFFQASPAKVVHLALANQAADPLTINWFNGADLFNE